MTMEMLTRWSKAAGSRLAWIIPSALLLFGAVPFSLKWLCWTTSLSDGIYIGTGIAVLWYTVETYYLRQEMVRANEIAVLPLVIARVEQDKLGEVAVFDPKASHVVLRNIGKSPALYVKVADFDLEKRISGTTGNRIEGVDVIEAGQQVPVESFGYHIVGEEFRKTVDSLVSHLKPGIAAQKTYRVTICYEDINGGKHQSVMQMGKGGIRLLSHS